MYIIDNHDTLDVEVRNLSRVTKIIQHGKNYAKSQLNMRLKVTLDQCREGADSFEARCKWKPNFTLLGRTTLETYIEYIVTIPITHDVFHGTDQMVNAQSWYEPCKEKIEELENRNIECVNVSIKEPLVLSPVQFDELLTCRYLRLKNHLMTFIEARTAGRQVTMHSYTLKNGDIVYSCGCELDRVLVLDIVAYDAFVRQEIGVINGECALFYPQRIEVIK